MLSDTDGHNTSHQNPPLPPPFLPSSPPFPPPPPPPSHSSYSCCLLVANGHISCEREAKNYEKILTFQNSPHLHTHRRHQIPEAAPRKRPPSGHKVVSHNLKTAEPTTLILKKCLTFSTPCSSHFFVIRTRTMPRTFENPPSIRFRVIGRSQKSESQIKSWGAIGNCPCLYFHEVEDRVVVVVVVVVGNEKSQIRAPQRTCAIYSTVLLAITHTEAMQSL